MRGRVQKAYGIVGDNLKKLIQAQFLDDAKKMRLFPNADIAIAAAR